MHAMAEPTPPRMISRAGTWRRQPVAFVVLPTPGLAGIPCGLGRPPIALPTREPQPTCQNERPIKIRGMRAGNALSTQRVSTNRAGCVWKSCTKSLGVPDLNTDAERAEDSDEQLDLDHLNRNGLDDRPLLVDVVDEKLLAALTD